MCGQKGQKDDFNCTIKKTREVVREKSHLGSQEGHQKNK